MAKETFFVKRKILNLKSAFREKLLCDGPTFSAGDACHYGCKFCYVSNIGITRNDLPDGVRHEDVIVRRSNPIEKLHQQLFTAKGKPKFSDSNDTRVCFSSPLVDVAATIELSKETISICREILTHTSWQIRLLSKSNLLPFIAKALEPYRDRIIYGVSTGTANNAIAKAFETGTPLVTKRLESLHWLQDHGFRTYGMICPSLPQPDGNYTDFSKEICDLIRVDRCEHVWAEVINVRGESLTATSASLREGGFLDYAKALAAVSGNSALWEEYNQATFMAHSNNVPADKLRYLTYVTKKSLPFWKDQVSHGAVLLGAAAPKE
jgi:DNA repair photolyase